MIACAATCWGVCVANGGPPAALAGVVGGAAVMGLCTLYCGSACSGTVLACLSEDVRVTTINKGYELDVPMYAVRPGDSIVTLQAGGLQHTRVLRNVRQEGNFSFLRLYAASETHSYQLELTPDHVVASFANISRSPAEPERLMRALPARALRYGDELLVLSGTRARVVHLEELRLPVKHTLVTESGTAVANGVFVTTMCGLDDRYLGRLDWSLKKWRDDHQSIVVLI